MVDFEFRNELIKENFSLNYCYQCGTCSSSCPVALITEGEYNPRKIIEQSLLGLKDLLIKDQKPNIWLCCTCQMCVEECPQNVFLTEIFERIKITQRFTPTPGTSQNVYAAKYPRKRFTRALYFDSISCEMIAVFI